MARNSEANSTHEELLVRQDQTDDHEATDLRSNASAEDAQAPTQGAASQDQLGRLQTERDSLLDRLARLQAEFENYRKRNAREQSDFREYATAEAAKRFLPVLDSFNLALRTNAPDQSLRQGVDLIRKQMQEVLSRLGVEAIPTRGEQFDPRVHEAIEMVDTSDTPDHQIIEELQPGYKIKDRLLRPAMVRVARNSARQG